MIICIAGKNEIAVKGMQYILNNIPPDTQVYGILNKNDDGVNSWQPSFKHACIKNNVPIVSLEACYAFKDMIFLSLEFDRIIKPENFLTKSLFNIHFSLLPAYKGMYTSILPILNGEEYTGVTLHKIDHGIDTGNIIKQQKIRIEITLNSRELYDLYNRYAFELLIENFNALINNNYIDIAQPSTGSSYFSKKAIDFGNVFINSNTTAWQLHNQVRAFAFRDYQLPEIFGAKIYKSEILDNKSVNKPGTIIQKTDVYVQIDTIDYQVRLFYDRQAELFNAAEAGDIKTISSIKDSGYDIKVKNKIGWDIFIIACYHNHEQLVNYLLDAGFDVNSTNYKGTTAFMYAQSAASRSGNTSIMDLLINRNADLNLRDDKGLNVLDYAHQNNSTDILAYLNQY